MNSRECETCVKRKTMYCPNSSECLETEDKIHYQNRIMLLEQNNQLKEVIEEVREYINRVEFTDYIPNTKNYMRLMKIKCDLLQILDKVKGGH